MTVLPPRYFRPGRLTPEEAGKVNPNWGPGPGREPCKHIWLGAGLGSHMAGMAGGMPGAEEFLAALAADEPDGRQRYMVAAWIEETDWIYVLRAWLEGSYSWRELAAGAGKSGGAYCDHGLLINMQHIPNMLPSSEDDRTEEEVRACMIEGMLNVPPGGLRPGAGGAGF